MQARREMNASPCSYSFPMGPETEQSDTEVLQSELEQIDRELQVSEQFEAVATFTGVLEGALVILVRGAIKAWDAFCTQLGTRLADDAYDGLRGIFSRRRVIITDGSFEAIITRDVPPEAISALADIDRTPPRRVEWDKGERKWKNVPKKGAKTTSPP